MSEKWDLLYKYRPFDERALNMLREQTVWMAIPTSFNDPFDCQPLIVRNDETEHRDRKLIIENYRKVIKRALRGGLKDGAQLGDRQCQPIPHRKLVILRRLLESQHSDDKKYRELAKYFPIPPSRRES